MKESRRAGKESVFASIAELAKGASLADDERSYSISLEFALMELVRDEMRWAAQRERPRGTANDLLRAALESVTARVENALSAEGYRLDLGKYERQLLEKLKFPSREIFNLGIELVKSRSLHKLGAKQELVSDSGRRFIVRELGLREAIHGLLVEPTRLDQTIDIDALREQDDWQVSGEWFPYEVSAGNFVFVIDDDGSIFVSTANLPSEIREEAHTMICRVADLLYG